MKQTPARPGVNCCGVIPPPNLDADYPKPNAKRLRRLMSFAELTPDTAAELAGISRRSVASYMDDNDPAESLLFSYSIECQAVAKVNQSLPVIDSDKEKLALDRMKKNGLISPRQHTDALIKMQIRASGIKRGDYLHITTDQKTGRYNLEKATDNANAMAAEDIDPSQGIYWNQQTGFVSQQKNTHLFGTVVVIPDLDLK